MNYLFQEQTLFDSHKNKLKDIRYQLLLDVTIHQNLIIQAQKDDFYERMGIK